MFLQESEH